MTARPSVNLSKFPCEHLTRSVAGRHEHGYKVQCSRSKKIFILWTGKHLNEETIIRRLRAKGWERVKGGTGWILNGDRPKKEPSTMSRPTLTAMPPKAPVVPEPSTSPTLAPTDRTKARTTRAVIALLEEVFNNGEEGFWKPGWNDARVAEELDLSNDFVNSVRLQFFGAEKLDPEIQQLQSELKILKDMVTEFENRLTKLEQRKRA